VCDVNKSEQRMTREHSVAFLFDNFLSPDELRGRNLELNLSDYYVLEEIEALLESTEDDQYAVLYEGFVGHNVMRFLIAKGYRVRYVRNKTRGECTQISWSK